MACNIVQLEGGLVCGVCDVQTAIGALKITAVCDPQQLLRRLPPPLLARLHEQIHAVEAGRGGAAAGSIFSDFGKAVGRVTSVAKNIATGNVDRALRQGQRLVTQDAAKLASNPIARAALPVTALATKYGADHPEQVAAMVPGVGPVAASAIKNAAALSAKVKNGDPQAQASLAALSRLAQRGDKNAVRSVTILRELQRLAKSSAVISGDWVPLDPITSIRVTA